MVTYMIQGKSGGPVKIGRSNNSMERLVTLQTGNPDELAVVLEIDGDHEAELHSRFEFSRIRGEWFAPTDDIAKFAEERGGHVRREVCGRCSVVKKRYSEMVTMIKRHAKGLVSAMSKCEAYDGRI